MSSFDAGRRAAIAEAVALLDREIAWRRKLGAACDEGSAARAWAFQSADVVIDIRNRIEPLAYPPNVSPAIPSAFARGVREVLGLRPLRRAFWRWVGRRE